MSNELQFIAPRVPFIDARTNWISREWYACLQGIYNRTGGITGVSSAVLDEFQQTLYASIKTQNTSQLEQAVRDLTHTLNTARKPKDLTSRLDEIEARLTALEKKPNTDSIRIKLDEILTITLAS